MSKHRTSFPEQLPLPLPRARDAQARRLQHDAIVLLLAQLLLSATRLRSAGGERDDDAR